LKRTPVRPARTKQSPVPENSISVPHTSDRTAIAQIVWLLSLTAAVCIAFFFGLDGFRRDFRIPITFYGDSLFPEMLAKTILDHGWWWSNPSLSAPGTYDALSYPSNSNVDAVVVWLFSQFLDDIGRLINMSWLAMLALAGCIAAACLRVLGISRTNAWALGLLYAFAPFALYRQIDHLSLVIYLVPVAATVALLLASGALPMSRNVRLLLAGGCVLIGFNYIYYAFFSVWFLIVGAAIGYFTYRRRSIAVAACVCAGLIVGATALNLAPSLRSWARDGRPMSIPHKMPAESEAYGLKIRQLISPLREHTLNPFRAWAEKEGKAAFPLETENVSSRLGLVASLGFLGLLGTVFIAGRRFGDQGRLLLAGGQLSVAGVLLGTIGGLGSLFALLISPDIRAWNRVSPFLMFFALAGVGIAADAIVRWAGRRFRIRTAGVIVGAGICTIGLYDQLHALKQRNQEHATFRTEFLDVQATVQQLESRLARGSMVYQLPFRPFPTDEGSAYMGPYLHFRPYLVSRNLRWSYPPLSNSQAQYEARLGALTAPQRLEALKRDGFAAVLIDRLGYADQGASVIKEITQALGPGALLVSGPRYTAFSL
jgi:phosphoglycerol transferase